MLRLVLAERFQEAGCSDTEQRQTRVAYSSAGPVRPKCRPISRSQCDEGKQPSAERSKITVARWTRRANESSTIQKRAANHQWELRCQR